VADVELYTDLRSLDARFDDAALRTPGASAYCSSSDWTGGAIHRLHPELRPVVMRSDDHWAAFALGEHDQIGPYIQPLEADWGFASPLLGPDPAASAEVLEQLLVELAGQWKVALLSGLPQALARSVSGAIRHRYRAVHRTGIRCQVAWLDGGVDGFLSRRSALVRRNLRRDRRRAESAGITFDLASHTSDASALLDRIIEVDKRSWKWAAGQSVLQNERYRGFYQDVLERAGVRAASWAMFARDGDLDVAYVFGGVVDTTYRGFQLGFDQSYGALGLGNQVQFALIEQLAAAGVLRYDLGMEMDYKRRWSDEILDLATLVILPRL
jgi:CelD/BcsL family acetyltransferase involved in cellulose biosynthesis